MEIDKFALRAFNHLTYNREISGPLATNTLLSLPEYYTPKKSLKRANLKNLQLYFPKIIFYNAEDKEAADNLIPFGSSMIMPTSIFDNYHYRGEELKSYSFYNYIKTIFCVKYSTRQRGDILFDRRHPNLLSKVQRPPTSQECDMLVGLVVLLSTNERVEDAIRGGHPKTDTRRNDVALILLALFVPWNQLPKKFFFYGALLGT